MFQLKEYMNLVTLLCKDIEHVLGYVLCYFLSTYISIVTGMFEILCSNMGTYKTCISKIGICTSNVFTKLVKETSDGV